MKIYSKSNLIRLVSSMNSSGRAAHGIVITGERGSGRMTSARYIAMALLCEDLSEPLPCGTCRNCRRIEEHIHPDVICPEGEGASRIYSVKTIRALAADALVMPNDGERKVYIFRDCEKLPPASQNALLKTIEEPPDHAYFIFTANSEAAFLPTVLSRVISIGISLCSEEDCLDALRDTEKYSDSDIKDAVSAYHGNIGKCIEYLEKGNAFDICEKSRNIALSMLSSDRYSALRELSSVSGRDNMREVILMLDNIVRDALCIRIMGEDADIVGCAGNESKRLSDRLTEKKAQKIHAMLREALALCANDMNINQNALCCKICSGLF